MTNPWRKTSYFRRVLLCGFMLMTPLVAFAAVAWACNPQAYLVLDKTAYQPGSAITAYGSYFPGNVSITVSGPAESTTVQTSPDGGFSTQLTAPTTPGNYTITASRPTGGFAPASFEVTAPPPKPPVTDPPAEPAPAVPSPALVSAPDLLGPVILRQPARASETVFVARNGSFTLFCGRFEESGVNGTCGAASTRTTQPGERPFLALPAKPFRAEPGRRVRLRFYLTPPRVRRVKAAKQVRMRGTVVARDLLGNQKTRTFVFTLKAPR